MDIAVFLLACYADDEAEAWEKAADWPYDGGWSPKHVAHVIADLKAKRLIVRHEAPGPKNESAGAISWEYVPPVLALLALPYADRPGYQLKWAEAVKEPIGA